MRDFPKILITGGAGYIGAHTAVALHEAGYIPVIMDNFSGTERQVIDKIAQLIGYKPEMIEADCCNLVAFEKVFQQYPDLQGVIHFAAFKAVGESVAHPLKYYHNNLVSLYNLLHLIGKYSVKQLVFSSSCTVYGQPKNLPVTEQSPILPAESPYGNTKQIGEEMIADVIKSGSALQAIALRYFNPIGAHPSALLGELPLGVPNNLVPLITQTAAGWRNTITVFGNDYPTSDGTCIRDYIHVCDLADAHVQALKILARGGNSQLSYINIGTGQGNSVLEVIQTFENVNNIKLNYTFGPRRSGDVVSIYADVTRSAETLGWKSKYTLADALQHAWAWQLTLTKP